MSQQPFESDDDRTVIRPSAGPAAPPTAAAPVAAELASATALSVGTRLGEFELTSVLGEGGFGIVYLAWDHSLERRVAVKEYMPSALAMRDGSSQVQVRSARHRETFEAGRKSFVNEARLLAQFDHPSLVKVYRFWEANGTAYMVMPFYEGSTLKSVLAEMPGPPDEAWLMALLAPLTEALAVLHSERCYHRDIAPDNVILLAGSGRPLLLDFGAARRVIGDMTQALTVILKPGYAPVEQYADSPGMKQGPWTDIYALAASVYYAILGKTPPPSVSRLMSDAYVPLTQSCAGRYSERFLAAIDRALKVRPEERTASVAELREDLGLGAVQRASSAPELQPTLMPPTRGDGAPAATQATASGAPPLASPSKASQAPAGSRWWLAGGAGLLVAGAAAWWALGSSGTGAPPAAPASGAPPQATAALEAFPPGPAQPAASTGSPVATQAPPPAAAPPQAASALDVPAEFEQVLARQTPGFGVRVTQAPTTLRADKDTLKFSVTSDRDGDVTVLAFGPDGSLIKLLPADSGERLQIKAGQTLRLPRNVGIAVSEPLGTEQLLVLVSSVPRRWEALGGRYQDGYLSFPTGESAARMRASRPAEAGPYLLAEPAGPCQGERCIEYGAARMQFDVVR